MKLSRQLMLGCITLMCVMKLAHADTADRNSSSYYFGVDLGPTYLQPDVNGTSYSITDKTDIGYGVLGGFSWSPRGRVETQFHELGSAKVGLQGVESPIDYRLFNFDAQYDLWKNANSQIFASMGLTSLSFDTDAPAKKENSTNVKFGAGYEYFFNDRWSTRVAYSQFSGDAGLLSLGLNRHFGRDTNTTPESPPESTQETPIDQQDQDKDGVTNKQDACPKTLNNLTVDDQGCSTVFDHSFPNINFAFNSTKLTEKSKSILDEIVHELKNIPTKKVEVQAHTDSIGSDAYNIGLSNSRAESIASYLISHGIPEARLVAKGYGETLPVAGNDTESGRAKNRRAEFKLIN